MAARIC